MDGGRQFHIDIGDHSVTVNLGHGRSGSAELLVDGKVIGYVRERAAHHLRRGRVGGGSRTAVHRSDPAARALGLGAPECTLEIGGDRVPMPERRTRAHRG